jgi:hypothetical protein
MQCKGNNDIPNAMIHMKNMKEAVGKIADLKQKFPGIENGAPQQKEEKKSGEEENDPIELEEKYHEPDDLACISVFTEEVEYCKL